MKRFYVLFILIALCKLSISQEVFIEKKGIVTIVGTAFNSKGGAIIKTKKGAWYFVENKINWTEKKEGKKIKIKGELFKITRDIKGTKSQMTPLKWMISPLKIKVKSLCKTKLYKQEINGL